MNLLIGIDWGQEHHHVYFMNPNGAQLASFEIAHAAEGFAELDDKRAKLGVPPTECLVAVETAHNLLVDFLWSRQYIVYVIATTVVKGSRGRITNSGASSDARSAYLLADLLRTERKRFLPWLPDAPLIWQMRAKLSLIEALRRDINRWSNRLRAVLLRYYPSGPPRLACSASSPTPHRRPSPNWTPQPGRASVANTATHAWTESPIRTLPCRRLCPRRLPPRCVLTRVRPSFWPGYCSLWSSAALRRSVSWVPCSSSTQTMPSLPLSQAPGTFSVLVCWSSSVTIGSAFLAPLDRRPWPAPARSPSLAARASMSSSAGPVTATSVASSTSSPWLPAAGLSGHRCTGVRSTLALARKTTPIAVWPIAGWPSSGNYGTPASPMMNSTI